jgi:8-oxo-(d)GTP phosphatase
MNKIDIDPEWLQRELVLISDTLRQHYPAIAPETVEDTVCAAAAKLVSGARIANYLPILIQRHAQAQVQALHSQNQVPRPSTRPGNPGPGLQGPRVIRAAGRLEVALVHRTTYDDWSLPKGTLSPGEHPLLAAVRNLTQETGHSAVVGRPLGQTTYPHGRALKRVRYWAMQATSGTFTPTAEVDMLEWLPVEAALERLDYPQDRDLLATFAADPAPTRAWILVRHASAGDRQHWPGQDRERPLDAQGQAQAAALVPILAAYGIQRVVSADVRRCLETVGPYAHHAGLTVEIESLFSEDGHAAAPDAAGGRLIATVGDPRPSAVCSQGGAIPDLLTRLGAARDIALPAEPQLDKGAYWVLHLGTATDPGQVVEVEESQPLP